jgi:hypothetical protein
VIKKDDLAEEGEVVKIEISKSNNPVVESFLKFRQSSINEQYEKKKNIVEKEKNVFVGLPSYNIYVRFY